MHNLVELTRKRRGNVTMMWVAGLPVFAIVLMFLASLVIVWMAHSNSQVAADAGSVAATKKLDEWFQYELALKVQEKNNIGNENDQKQDQPSVEDPFAGVWINEVAREKFVQWVVSKHEEELKETVRDYVVRNGGNEHGVIVFPVNGRVMVQARTDFRPMMFQEEFKNTYIKGNGTGPTRYYLKWLPEKAIQIEY